MKHRLLALFLLVRIAAAAPVYGYRIIHTYPHDSQAFTQGLIYLDGYLYESTGLNGHSSVRMVKLETGQVLQKMDVASRYFAEGLTAWKNRLFQLTWREGTAFVYDRFSFHLERTFTYHEEGWGLTQDGRNLILSDGTDGLRFLDPETFAEKRKITVTDAGQPVSNLNELEYVKGEVYANVWQTDRIARISPRTGQVAGWIDLGGLLNPAESGSADVLNGIAYDAAKDRLFVTGKLWPKLFEVQLVRR